MGYNEVILNDTPALFWDLDEGVVATVIDTSGNGNHGRRFTSQVATTSNGASPGHVAGFSLAQNDVSYAQGARSGWIPGRWQGTGGGASQVFPGCGYRAGSYKPYASGSRRSFEAILYKTEDTSFATIFSADGDTGSPATPHPTWEMGASGMMRFYANVQSFPLGWVDWGTANTNHPLSTFQLNQNMHIVCQFDDALSMADWWVNGISMGQQGPNGYFGTRMNYSRTNEPGNFQFGWRGGAGFFPSPGNAEVYGGFADKIAVYEYLLTPEQIRRHSDAAAQGIAPPTAKVDRDIEYAIRKTSPQLWLPFSSAYPGAEIAGNRVVSLVGGVNYGQSTSIVRGSSDLGTAFDGTDDYVGVAFTPNLSSRGYLVFAYLDTSGPTTQTLIGSSGTAAQNFRVQVVKANGNVVVYNQNSSVTFSAAWPLDGLPHSLYINYNPAAFGIIALYIDGKLFQQTILAGPATYHASVGTLQLGTHASGTDMFKGTMQLLLVFATALGNDSIASRIGDLTAIHKALA